MEKNGNNWNETVKKAVWGKGRIHPDYSPNMLRWDRNGHMMMWSEYGRMDSKFGWGIETIHPKQDHNPGQDPATDEKNIKNLYPLNLWFGNN